jgi:RNA polymerase sigma factor (sigma-70 family)
MTLLELADKYEPIDENPRFHSYVLKAYHYKVYHNLIKVTQDPLYYTSLEGLRFREDDFITYDDIDEDRYDNKYIQLMTESDTEVDDNWIAGFTADLFKDLSPVDRKILKLKYIDKLDDKDVAEELGVCRATINRRKIKLKQVIQKELTKLKLLK